MPQATITAALLDPKDPLTTAPTTTVQQAFAADLVAALNGKTFSYLSNTNSKLNQFSIAVRQEIELLLADPNEMYQWWPEVNQSMPVGNIWQYDSGKIYVHARRAGAVIAVAAGAQFRYLNISIPA